MRKGFRHDNRGLTLVELLVSVMILGLIAVPLLHAFVSSAGTASKSRALGDATLAARNVAETIDATHMDTLVSSLNGGTADSLFLAASAASELPEGVAELENGAASYGFRLYGLQSGNHDFDARVTLDASLFPDANNVLVTKYVPMDVVFSQPSGAYENPDFLSAKSFSNTAEALSGDTGYTADFFLRYMTRTITVSVTKDDADEKITAAAVYDYSYLLSYTLTTIAEDGTEITETYTQNLTDTFSYEFFRDTELSSIYFFFFPSYMSAAVDKDDRITIENPDDLDFSFFLIKQKALVLDGGGGSVSTMDDWDIHEEEAHYDADVVLRESVYMTTPHASLYSNINIDVSGLTPEGYSSGDFQYRIFRGTVWFRYGTISGTLVATEQQNRFYRVAVAVYSAGADMDTDTPLFTLDASKLD